MSILVALHHVTGYRYDRLVLSAPKSCACAQPLIPVRGAELCSQGDAGGALRELAAGPAWQLAGPLRFHRKSR